MLRVLRKLRSKNAIENQKNADEGTAITNETSQNIYTDICIPDDETNYDIIKNMEKEVIIQYQEQKCLA